MNPELFTMDGVEESKESEIKILKRPAPTGGFGSSWREHINKPSMPTPEPLSMQPEMGTLPKCNPPEPPTNPWVAAPTDSTSYPRISAYDFQVSQVKRVDRDLDVYYAGITDPITKRRWAFTIGTPTCYVTFAPSTYEGEPKNCRVLLSPHFYTNSSNLPDTSAFEEFMQHVDGISNRFKTIMSSYYGREVEDWSSPLKIENGFIVGIQAKIKNDDVRQAVLLSDGVLKCSLKLICVYFARGRSGLSFELTEAHEP
jgi:hypothetical protein